MSDRYSDCIIAETVLIRLLISQFIVPLIVNKIPRYSQHLSGNEKSTTSTPTSIGLGLHTRSGLVGFPWSCEPQGIIPRPQGGELMNQLKAGGTTVTKERVGNTVHLHGLKSCSAHKVPLLMREHVQACTKFLIDLDDWKKAWKKVMWSYETILPKCVQTLLPTLKTVWHLCWPIVAFTKE